MQSVIEAPHPFPTTIAKSTPSQNMTESTKAVPAWGSSPWGQISTPAPQSLEDVMSEELAEQLQNDEHKSHMSDLTTQNEENVDIDALLVASQGAETSDDFILAQMLQHEFDREHDAILNKEEEKWNGTSKVKISFKNYRSLHPRTQEEEDLQDEEEVYERVVKNDPVPKFNKSGISGKGKNIITKHDSNLSGQKNAMKIMDQFPPEFETGDASLIKMRLPNRVYNKLKRHSQEENKRSHKIHEKKEHSTAEMAVDAKTRLIMYKLVNNGVLESVEGVVSSGKESVVFHGTGGSMTNALVPSECAVKVFKTTLSEFKNRFEYIRGDVRFMGDEYKRLNPRKIIKIWAEKELCNLRRMESKGIPCPRAVVLKKHVLVMQFIGQNQVPAPKLKDAELSPEDLEDAYEQCVNNMKKMFHDCGLVHADLSAYNMLWYKDTLYFIDVAQGVDVMHPRAMEFLLRDCGNVAQFFSAAGVHRVMNKYDMFNDITGLHLQGRGKEFLSQIEQYEKNEEKLRTGKGKDYAFDYFFDKAQKEREEKRKHVAELFEDSDSGEDVSADIETEQSKLDPEIEEKLNLVLRLENVEEEADEDECPTDPPEGSVSHNVEQGPSVRNMPADTEATDEDVQRGGIADSAISLKDPC